MSTCCGPGAGPDTKDTGEQGSLAHGQQDGQTKEAHFPIPCPSPVGRSSSSLCQSERALAAPGGSFWA
jgi:hypothetical protein